MSTTTTDLRGELIRSLKGEYVEGFHFATEEDENQTVASLTNSAVRNFIALEESKTSLVVRYTLVKKKETATSRVYKIEVVKTGTEVALVVTDMATDELVNKIVLPEPERHDKHTFESIDDCIADFDSTPFQSALQAEANRTCEDQIAHVLCCLSNGSCFSVVLFIKPTSWRCRLPVALVSSEVFAL